eukprot:Nk52_evm26s2118 gene=Nk52_evmTU26s2118
MSAVDQVDVDQAKAYLMTKSTVSGTNLYDHLSDVVLKLLEEKPENACDVFEELSYEIKRSRYLSEQEPDASITQGETLEDNADQVANANMQKSLFLTMDPDDPDAEAYDNPALPDVLSTFSMFQSAGVGLGKAESFKLMLALKKLCDTEPLQTVRFWGKMFGLKGNYYIVEGEYKEGEGEEEEEEEPEVEVEEEKPEEEEGEEGEKDVLPVPQVKPKVTIPKETKTGANKYNYWVCSELGQPWIKLPNVTPQQICAARHITKFLYGNLEHQIESYPEFPGVEKNYLRAQIARISATCDISPAGYYVFEEGEDGDEDLEGPKDAYIVNPEFGGFPPRELTNLTNWVHHQQYILPQGRTVWFNPAPPKEERDDDDEEGEDDQEEPEIEPESGPSLLGPVSEDEELEGIPAWSARVSSNFAPQFSPVLLRSQAWPGACAVANGLKFANIYIGWGQKYAPSQYTPLVLPAANPEFEVTEESGCNESEDPTAEEEKALEEAKAAAAREAEGSENEEGGEEDEEEEDD